MDITKIKIAELVKSWVERSSVQQAELAKEMKMMPSSLSQMLNSHIPFPKDRLEYLVNRLNIPQRELDELNDLLTNGITIKRKLSPMVDLPVMPLSLLEKYTPMGISIMEFAQKHKTDTKPFSREIGADFVLVIDTDELEEFGAYRGDSGLFTLNFPKEGDYAILKEREKNPVGICVLGKNDDSIIYRFTKDHNAKHMIMTMQIQWIFTVIAFKPKPIGFVKG